MALSGACAAKSCSHAKRCAALEVPRKAHLPETILHPQKCSWKLMEWRMRFLLLHRLRAVKILSELKAVDDRSWADGLMLDADLS